ncbi:MAG: hypothetical protein ACK526_00155 [Planctomyces sp.]|jgi:hypothetical protein
MTSEPDDLNSRLQREFQRRGQKSDHSLSIPQKVEAVEVKAEVIESTGRKPETNVEEDQLGMINRLRLRHAESAHQLEKARLAYRTEMQLLQHQADAATRESRAFWDAKSVEVAETIKTYVQSTVRALEIDRLDSRNADIQRTYEATTAALEKAKASSLPEVMKDRLIQNILDNFENTLQRIQNDTIVARYDLD